MGGTDRLIENLRAIVGRDSVLSERDELLVYECDGLQQHKYPPRAVVFPHSTEEASEVVRLLNRAKVSFSPRGAGTGLSGGALAVDQGVVIELAQMKRVLKIDVSNRLAVVQTGLVNAHLSRAVVQHGLHYAPDPSSQMSCTIGGNIAENAGGIHCLKYGVTTDHVLAARVVLSDGSMVELNSSGNGYDLIGVFVGSEGTFGLATEATLRLTPNPAAVRTILAEFTNIDDASRAVSAIIAAGLIPAALEMVDGETIRAVESSVFAAGLPLDAEAALLIELDGLEAGLDDQAGKVEFICKQNNARSIRRARDENERKKLWAARKGAFGALGRVAPNMMMQDAVVPRSRLPEVLREIYRIGRQYNLRVANVFHAGDGNLHPFIGFDARDKDEVRRMEAAGRELMKKCVDVGGTITGEHGVGLDKSDYLPLIFNDDDMDAMLRVRAAFDPDGLCNPGKIIPTLRGCGEKRSGSISKAGNVEQQSGNEKELTGDDANDKWQMANGYRQSTANNQQSTTINRQSTINNRQSTISNRQSSIGNLQSSEGFDVDSARKDFISIVGEVNVGIAREGEAVVVEPSSIKEASDVLRLASSRRWTIVPAGAKTWLNVGNPLKKAYVIVSTERIHQITFHEPADLVATVEAGCKLSSFNQQIAKKGQWLPLDPPDDGRVTIGGVVATGLAGPLRLGYGPPRSHVLGMRVALSDGRIIRVGGRVVKNVAGYDLCKLFTGSYGTLCLILEVTFKLKPLPERNTTLVITSKSYSSLIAGAKKILEAPLLPVAVELLSPRAFNAILLPKDASNHFALLVRFEGTSKTVEFQMEQAKNLFKENSVEIIENDLRLWRGLSALPFAKDSNHTWRASVLSSHLESFLQSLEKTTSLSETLWHASVADGCLRVIEETHSEKDWTNELKTLRQIAQSMGGYLAIESALLEVKENLNSWSDFGSASVLTHRVKERLDPFDLLSRGRFEFE
jgi:glycolate oxidase subunit GlcD